MRKQIIIYIFALFVGLIIGFFVGGGSRKPNGNNLSNAQNSNSEKNIEYRSGGYQFISPLLECDSGQNLFQGQTAALKEKLKKIIQETIDQNKISNVAVYFRDLRNGPWFGINEGTKFVLASLMKVPVMIAYYKLAESDPSVLQKKIAVDQTAADPYEQAYKPSQRIQTGQTYTTEELIYYMIAFSDNDALTLLLKNIDHNLSTNMGNSDNKRNKRFERFCYKQISRFAKLLTMGEN